MERTSAYRFETQPSPNRPKPLRTFITEEEAESRGLITTEEEGAPVDRARYIAMTTEPGSTYSSVKYYTGRIRSSFLKNREQGTQIVYVLTNDSIPGQVKIGFTKNNAEDRARQLYQTGSPTPFQVAFEYVCVDGMGLEQQVHKALDEYRVNDKREFFYVDVETAKRTILEVAGENNG